MKIAELFEAADSKLEAAIKKVRGYMLKDKTAFSKEGYENVQMILDSLLAAATDKPTFERYYNKFLAKYPDAMDFVLEDLYAEFKVKTAEEFFSKAFGVTEAKAPPSQMDLDFSIAKIKEVKSEIDALAALPKYNPDNFQKAAEKRAAKNWQDTFAEAHWRMDFAILLHEEIIPAFNKIMDAENAAVKEKDVSALKKCEQDYKALVTKYNLIVLRRRVADKARSKLKIERGYSMKIIDAIDHILAVRDYAPTLVKQAGRTEEQNARAAKASAAMKMRWAE